MTHRILIASFLVPLLLAAPSIALANECGPDPQAILQSVVPGVSLGEDGFLIPDGAAVFLPDTSGIGADPHAMICRNWPAQPGLLLVALPLIAENTVDETMGDLALAILDAESLSVLARTRLEDMMVEDAIYISDLAFDTAYYRLAPGRIAFGLRLTQQGSSRVNPLSVTTLWLFERQGKDIVTILDNLAVHRSGGEWDGRCAGAFHTDTRTLAMADETMNGVAIIALSSDHEAILSTLEKDSCEQQAIASTSTQTLPFDGAAYIVPDDLHRGW